MVRASFYKIREDAYKKELMVTMLRKSELRELRYAFRRFQLSVKLPSLSDQLIHRIQTRLCFKDWKDYALEDRRIVKMLARAVKYRNRVLKKKLYTILKR